MRGFLCRTRRKQRGATLVEAAIVLPLLLILLFGIVDVGRLVFTKMTLHDAAQEGSLYGAYNPGDPSAVQSRVVDSMDNLALTTSNVVVQCPDPPGAVIRVTVEKTTTMFTPFFTGRTVTLSSTVDGDVLSDDIVCVPSADDDDD